MAGTMADRPSGGPFDGAGGDPPDGSDGPRSWWGRLRSWRDWYVWALIAGGAAFALGPSLVGARTLISVNFLTYFQPEQALEGNLSVGHELCQSDTVDSVMPAIHYVRQQIFGGHLGSWQGLGAGGGPLSALPNLGLLDPLSLPYWVLPLRWAPAFVVLLSWAAAILGTYLFLRRLSVGKPAATLAGFVFATSGFMVMWTNWPQTRTAALVPLLFWATDRAATRSRPGDAVLVAVVFASMLFGGFPAVTGWALYLAGGYFVVRIAFRYRRNWGAWGRAVAAGGGGLVLGGALSAVQMLPFLRFYQDAGFEYRSGYGLGGLAPSALTTLYAPGTGGLCVVQKNGTVLNPTSPVETVSYIGAAALVLALIGAAFVIRNRGRNQRGVRGYFALAVVVITAICYGSETFRRLVGHFPVFSGNLVGRIRSVLGFGLAVLVGLGFDWLASRGSPRDEAARPRGRPPRSWLTAAWAAAVFVGAAVVGVLALRASHRLAFRVSYLSEWNHAVKLPLVLLGVALVVAAGAAAVRRAGVTTVAFVVLPVLVVAQGVQFFHTVMPGDQPSAFYPNTPDRQFLATHLGHDRYASADLTLYPATGVYFGLRAATGHQFTNHAWDDLLTAVDPAVMLTPTNSDFGNGVNQNTIADQPILDQMAVKYFALPAGDLAGSPQPLPLTSGTVTAGASPLECSLTSGPIRGVVVKLGATLQGSRAYTGPTVDATVSDGATTVSSGSYLASGGPAGTMVVVPVAGEDFPVGRPLTVTLWATGARQPLQLAAAGGAAACSVVKPVSDQLKLVYAGPGNLIYERLTSLPRIRWASSTVVAASRSAQLEIMKKGLPGNAVLLSSPGPAAQGRPAAVDVTTDNGDRISALVKAGGAGYLVVADSMQAPGWSVAIDGHPAHILPADYAMVAVAVPAGTHRITWTYAAPGQVSGVVITGVAIVAAAALVWWDIERPRRLRRRRAPLGAHAARRPRPVGSVPAGRSDRA